MEYVRGSYSRLARYILAGALVALASAATAAPAEAPVTLGIEAEAFQFQGDWMVQAGMRSSANSFLFGGAEGATLPAVTAVNVPRAGRYHLWVRAMDFPQDRPGIRKFTVSVAGRKSEEVFGDHGQPEWAWEKGGVFDLPAGPCLLGVHDVDRCYPRIDALLLTTDETLTPVVALGSPRTPRVTPLTLPAPEAVDPLNAPPVEGADAAPLARIENEHLRIEFLPGTRGGKETVRPRVSVRRGQQWVDAGADASAEAYVVVTGKEAKMRYAGFYPAWEGAPKRTVTAEAGGARLETAISLSETIWNAGDAKRFLPRTAAAKEGRARLEFHPSPAGTLTAEWELRPGEKTARVALSFMPAADGDCSLGYHLPFRKELADVQEVLLPMMWHRRRLPTRPHVLLQPFMPTPIALVQCAAPGPADQGPGTRDQRPEVAGSGDSNHPLTPSPPHPLISWAITGEPAEIPFEWPHRDNPLFGMMIRDLPGRVHPAIYGPVPGTERARVKAGRPVRFSFRMMVQPGDWYSGFRAAADGVFGLRDYRTNVRTSLTDAVLNMIDLVMDDTHGGWWEDPKGPYQIETLNGVTHASPLTTLSLYRLTGDREIYRRRALPTMEFTLSRIHAHFSPEPENTGTHYPAGNMSGPVSLYGTTTFGGYREMTHGRTPAFGDFALPEEGVRLTRGYSHGQEFEEWLARHLLTGDAAALDRAKELADRYLQTQVLTPPTADVGPQPFFNLSFVPNWEGLLRMHEVTGERRYLDGAVFGARQLMTGIWTQPVVPQGETTLHPGGEYGGCVPNHTWWKGPEKYRLGFPRKPGDTPERRAPAWVASNVGLGFEQPVTYNAGDSGGRMIYQSAFAPNFLRLAAYTGDKTFEMYARNGVLGRWGSYPGYYVTGLTDMPLNPRYPLEGPDVSCIYYHHILPHLSWSIDYLVAEAGLRSGGKIAFPSQRQYGYAWFDSRVYGHAPGKVYGEEGAWLWLKRGVVTLDNPALNYLVAHNGGKLFVILMNESSTEETAALSFSQAPLGYDPARAKQVSVLRDGTAAHPVPLAAGKARVSVPARGLVVVTLEGVKVDVPAHRVPSAPKPGPHPGYVVVESDGEVEARAAAIQVAPGPWDAYVWCTAMPKQARKVTLHFSTGGAWERRDDTQYPFEFSVPVADPAAPLRFRLEGETPDGKAFKTPEAAIGATQ